MKKDSQESIFVLASKKSECYNAVVMNIRAERALKKKSDQEEARRYLEQGKPLTSEIVRKWLNGVSLPYAWLAAELGVSESTVKNWLSVGATLPSKREPEIHDIINQREHSERVFKDTRSKQVIIPDGDEPDMDYLKDRVDVPQAADMDVTYILPRHLYSLLEKKGRDSFKSVQQLTNEILYRWVTGQQLVKKRRKDQMYGLPPAAYYKKLEALKEKLEEKERLIRALSDSLEEKYEDVVAAAAYQEDPDIEKWLKKIKESAEKEAGIYRQRIESIKLYMNAAQVMGTLIDEESFLND